MSLEPLLIGLLWVVLAIIVIGVAYWALSSLAKAAAAPAIVTTGIQVFCVILIVIVMLGWITGHLPIPRR